LYITFYEKITSVSVVDYILLSSILVWPAAARRTPYCRRGGGRIKRRGRRRRHDGDKKERVKQLDTSRAAGERARGESAGRRRRAREEETTGNYHQKVDYTRDEMSSLSSSTASGLPSSVRADLPLLRGGEMDAEHVLRLTSARAPGAARRTAERVLARHGRVDVRALGAALPRAVALCQGMVCDSHGRLAAHTRTYSAPKGPKRNVKNRKKRKKNQTDDDITVAADIQSGGAAAMQDDMQYVSGISILVRPAAASATAESGFE
jgi:hypothetical protein